ncbi:MAG: hypothetical protein IJ447_01240 [Clostridia bacterium]|nr:hypothetical protein [Clostridia bacterium]
MSEYRLKTGKIGDKVVKTYKKIEDKFVDTFLQEDENNPTGYSLKCTKTAEKATKAYKKIEDTVVGSYQKIEDKFVETFLEKVEDEAEETGENNI